MILLDTSVLISRDLVNLDSSESYAASILSRAELEFGVAVARGSTARQRRELLAALDGLFDWLPFDKGTTRAYGIIVGAIHPHGPAQARRIDSYIAAHALQHGVPLMTLNPTDLRHLGTLVTVLTPPGRPG